MRITKVINNNIVSSVDDKNREIIVMGRGLGFGQKAGMELNDIKVEKIFRMDNRGQIKRLEDLLNDIPLETVQLVNEIVDNARAQIPDVLQESVYITLIDHISFALERQKQNIKFQNPLLYDVKRLYKNEYKIGKEAVEYINQSLGIDLPNEEAAAIALHFINARLGKEMPDTRNITKIVQNTLKIIQYFYNVEFKEDSFKDQGFIGYVKFFAQRVVDNEMQESRDAELDQLVYERYQKSYECTKRIKSYIFNEFQIRLTDSEMTDLCLHIERIVDK